jgi:hypothetical protein
LFFLNVLNIGSVKERETRALMTVSAREKESARERESERERELCV